MVIRRYEPHDLERVLGIWEAASKVGHPFLSAEFLAAERANIARDHLPVAETWVWDENGGVVAFIALLGNEVGALFVDPGRHRDGIGRALMDHARDLKGRLEVEVFEANALGQAFYVSYGFEPVRRQLHEDTGLVSIRMALPDPTSEEGPSPLGPGQTRRRL